MLNKRICIHADDLGASENINRTIKEGIDQGIINKVSLMMNGSALEEAVSIVKESSINSALHLNFSEGRPLSSPQDVPLLINSEGQFKVGYASFWFSLSYNQMFKSQVLTEIKSQVKRYQEFFPGKIKLDSHQHFHMIPPLMKLLLDAHKDAPLWDSIRTTREPFFFLKNHPGSTVKNIFSANIIKWLLLRFFDSIVHSRVKKYGIETNDLFCGVLYSGNMKGDLYGSMAKKLNRNNTLETAELLFHPGQASEDEESLWSGQKQFYDFYISENRQEEGKELLSLLEKNRLFI
ncbi:MULTISPECIES: carbohydrate deacetylase [unclassified Oceanispirochaeta]|uniref:carbohydrate deacetylase n=1 Tax=unclassified Oceanispirochaeta TaxID=2635722 RepID=UPI001314DC29|nr:MULTISPECIES: ChbG/HpnK family deacetylase [unclassified Oceanispirochaeta]MBF9017768.1 ChbG/HpnK family deacetylase [Oceanispirochaeta sp. M2]NPD74332.1 ChbG/HpnK family deacetylase [Oceanispirochaeta sp. M1]